MKIKRLIHIFIFMMLFVCVSNLSAQDYSDYLERAKQRLREGNCAKAQENYDLWKDFTKKADYSIERSIAECEKKGSIKETDAYQDDTTTATTVKKFHSGIKVGLNLSNIFNSTNDMDFSPQLKPDFHAGIFANMRFGSWGLQPELLYSRAGFKNNGNAVILKYITLPVMAKFYFGGFNLELGPYVSYLAAVSPGSTQVTIEEADFYSKAADIKLSDLKNGTDIGVAAGIGYDFDSGLTIGARYNQGLSDMAKNLQWKNSVAAISLGFKF
jgi:hypothetical protein